MNAGYWARWWKAAGIRAVKTFAQAAIGAIGATALISQVDWKMVVGAAALAAVLSLLTSLAGLPEVDESGAITPPDDAYIIPDEGKDDGTD